MKRKLVTCWHWLKPYLPFLVIAVFSLILLFPQLLTKGIIAGSDFLFHYNRFYETAMQIKEGNFSYFISLYGFHSSGRIVNALYGPYFAYFQGVLLLLSKSWFTYQLVSRFLLSSLAGLSLYCLLRRVSIRTKISLALALVYMTTFSVHYWTFRQGFSSWGASLMPWCLIPAIDFIQTKKVGVYRLALSVALMMQVHMLSAFLLILAYIPFYLYGFLRASDKKQVMLRGILAIGLTILLTSNLWAAILQIGSTNSLIEPFVNSKLYLATVNQRSIQWLITPYPLLFLLLYHLYFSFKNWREFDRLLGTVTATFFILFVLSSSIFPWYSVVKLDLSFVNLIQFPFRFFVPATVLLLLAIGLVIERYFDRKWPRLVSVALSLVVVISLGHILSLQQEAVVTYASKESPVKKAKHQYIIGESSEVKESFYSTDLSTLLTLVEKGTPDYLPTDETNTENKYLLYAQYILEPTTNFEKEQVGNHLVLSWEGESEEKVTIPIAKYHQTVLILNGEEVTASDYSLSGIGTPELLQKAGLNRLEVYYQIGEWFTALLVFNGSVWGGVLVSLLFVKGRRQWLRMRLDTSSVPYKDKDVETDL